ncbi:MAG TPA: Gfo/Idh/MocA family oxidoreductase [Verrucomicrobiales bacterium]|nr:Gfo/Idh/MocA family oxidoreductase [Verrucomicrobiales bacterium]
MQRRRFILTAGAGTLTAAATSSLRAQDAPSQRLRVGVMGLGRGMAHVNGFQSVPGVEIAYLCDVDSRRLESAASQAAKGQETPVQTVTDFRRILEDKDVDILSIAAPNFWHAPATILACQAGKHVYVEKPGSHNAFEALAMVETARHHNRRVQMGNQRRSAPAIREGIEQVRSGAIGSVRFARCWYDAARGSIGKGQPAPAPNWLDYDLWQGPVPETPYRDNLVHYNWHWMWTWGGGELANNGVHALDVARWGLGVDYPAVVSCAGGRYHFDDDQETPDTSYAVFDFGSCGAAWDSSSCLPRRHEHHPFVSFYGENGILSIEAGGYRIHDPDGKERQNAVTGLDDLPHFTNFVNSIRKDEPLHAEIGDAQISAMLCHLGNMAYRTASVVRFDGGQRRVIENDAAQALWKRSYREGWAPTI